MTPQVVTRISKISNGHFFDKTVATELVKFSILFATQKYRLGHIAINKIYCFLGVLLVSGYCTASRKKNDISYTILYFIRWVDHTNIDQDKQIRCILCHKKCNFRCKKCEFEKHKKVEETINFHTKQLIITFLLFICFTLSS